jgi:hypothetical protein
VPWCAYKHAKRPLDDDELGGIAVRLALRFPDWMQRRVEHVSYLDGVSIRHAEGVMFRWPPPEFFFDGARPSPGQTVYVPLDLLTKEALTGLEGLAPDGSPFPMLPFARATKLASAGITALVWGRAEELLKTGELEHELGDDSVKIIDLIVTSPPSLAEPLLGVLDDPAHELGKALTRETEVRGLLKELGENVMLLAPAVYRPGEELVYRYTYSEPLPGYKGKMRALIWLGLADLPARFERLSLGWSASYHFEVDAPPDVRLPRVRLWGTYAPPQGPAVTALIAEDGDRPVVDLHARRPSTAALGEPNPSKPASRPPVFPSLTAGASSAEAVTAAEKGQATRVERFDHGYAEVRFRVPASGTFLAAAVVSLLTALLLLAARTRLPELDGQISATLLLALPVLALGYLTRPGEHSVATQLLAGIRALALLVGACALLVAGILGGGFLHHTAQAAPAYRCTSFEGAPAKAPAITSLSCAPNTPAQRLTTIPRGPHLLVDLATWIAVGFTAVLCLGWASSQWRPSWRL